MSLRRDLSTALSPLSLPLLLVGTGIFTVQFVGWTVLTTGIAAIEPAGSRIVIAIAGTAWTTVTLPLLVGIYEPIRRETGGVVETVTAALEAVRDWYLSLLIANAVAVAVALAGGTFALVSWLVADTGVQFARYALSEPLSRC